MISFCEERSSIHFIFVMSFNISSKINPPLWLLDVPQESSPIRLNSYLQIINIVDSTLCEWVSYEDIDHIIFSCPVFDSILTNHLHRGGHIEPFQSRFILVSSSNVNIVKLLFEFLNVCINKSISFITLITFFAPIILYKINGLNNIKKNKQLWTADWNRTFW